tara:strand:- start:1281 stop:1700 length:420 start_codon:yes stop_codon:yes gene_type:complete
MKKQNKNQPNKEEKKEVKEVKASEPKKSLNELNQTHGMVDKQKYEPTTLDQVWGDDGLSKYNTMDPTEYAQRVNAMGLADLKNEAIRVGLLPVDNTDQLRDRLKNEFMGHVNSYRKPLHNPKKPFIPSDEVTDILKEGR